MKARRAAALAAMTIVVALGSIQPAHAATVNVSVGDNFYDPGTVTISVGDTVAWTHNGQAPHTVTADDGSFDSHPNCPADLDACMEAGDTYSRTFSAAGTVGYFCKVHGQTMSGTVVVESGGGTTPSPTGTLPDTGASSGTVPFAIIGGLLLVAGAGGLLLLRRRA